MGKQARLKRENKNTTGLLRRARIFDMLGGKVDAVISIDNVEDYCFRNGPPLEGWKDYPVVRPPFNSCFIECSETKQPFFREIGITGYGVSALVVSRAEGSEEIVRLHMENTLGRTSIGKDHAAVQEYADVVNKDAVGVVFVGLWYRYNETYEMLTAAPIPLNADGSYKKSFIAWMPLTIPRAWSAIADPKWRSERGWDFMTEYQHSMLSVVMMGISLMHCKNVELIDRNPDSVDSVAFERKFGRPMTTYKVLAVQPIGKTSKRDDKPQQQFDIMPLHIRRGNFATYTADAPLFGKYVGTYWRPATMVGSEKNGVVEKDYELEAMRDH